MTRKFDPGKLRAEFDFLWFGDGGFGTLFTSFAVGKNEFGEPLTECWFTLTDRSMDQYNAWGDIDIENSCIRRRYKTKFVKPLNIFDPASRTTIILCGYDWDEETPLMKMFDSIAQQFSETQTELSITKRKLAFSEERRIKESTDFQNYVKEIYEVFQIMRRHTDNSSQSTQQPQIPTQQGLIS